MKSYQKNLIKTKLIQFLLTVLYIIVAFVGPIAYAFLRTTTGSITFNFALTYTQQALMTEESITSLSFTFIFTVAVGILNFSKFIKERIANLMYGFTMQLIYFIKGAALPFALWSLAWYIGSWKDGSEAFIVIGLFMFVANCIVKLVLNHFDYLVGKKTRQNEMREVLDERSLDK